MSTFYNPELVRNQQQQELEHHYRMLSLDKDLRNKYGINRNQAVAGLSAPEQQEGIQASEAANATGVRADSLFGGINNSLGGFGGLFGGGNGTFGNLFETAKDMAKFRLGLDQEQARFSRGLREEEAQSDFGRNFKLQDQRIRGEQDLQNLVQSATTGRLNNQLNSQQTMQQRGFDQQNLFRAQSAALALRGLR
jgi:hypothetical protein